MSGNMYEETGQTIAFVLMDRFSMNAFASVIETFANSKSPSGPRILRLGDLFP